jgi:hypothetical protein
LRGISRQAAAQKRDLSVKRYVYFWADGIHVQARLEDDAQCLLVINLMNPFLVLLAVGLAVLGPMVCRLAAGGRRIRTLGPAARHRPIRC